MNKTILLSAAAMLFATGLMAQQKTEKFWGNKGYDVCYSAAATNDGGYILTGLTQSGADTTGDIVVIKTNAAGTAQWTMTEGGPKLEGGNNVIQTADGGFMVSGHTEDYGADDCDAFLMKLDNAGNKQWLKVYGGQFDDICEGTIEMPDGSFVFAGITASYGNGGIDGNRHAYFVKTNSKGEKIWDKYYAGNGSEYAYSIAALAKGGFLAVGWTSSFGKGEQDAWLLRLTDDGDTLWTRRYQREGDSRYFKIIPTADNGFMLAGYTTKAKTSKPQGLIVKLDAEGKQLWDKTYGNGTDSMLLQGIAQLPNGNFMLTGTTFENDNAGMIYILTVDGMGNKLFDEECGGSFAWGNCIAVQGNNGYLVAGSSVNNGDLKSDLYYRTVNNTVTGILTQTMSWPHMYPNPMNAQTSVILLPEDEAYQTVKVEVTTATGKLISKQENILAKDIVLDRMQFTSGNYLYRVTCNDGKVFKGKFVVE